MELVVTVNQGDPLIDTYRLVRDPEDFDGYAEAAEFRAGFESGTIVAFLIEMDTKYAVSEALNMPLRGARFWLPEDSIEAEDGNDKPTDFLVDVGPEWTARVLFGRYDHLLLLSRK